VAAYENGVPPAYFWLLDCGALLVVLAAVKKFVRTREAGPQQWQSIVAQPEKTCWC
jgi:hypothetical protein